MNPTTTTPIDCATLARNALGNVYAHKETGETYTLTAIAADAGALELTAPGGRRFELELGVLYRNYRRIGKARPAEVREFTRPLQPCGELWTAHETWFTAVWS